jgi:hypothetical protein
MGHYASEMDDPKPRQMPLPAEWKDKTTYSQGEDRVPTTWSLDRGGLHIVVTSGHIAYRGTGTWVMHCEPWYNTKELEGVTTAEQAQEAALKLVRAKIDALYSAFAQ